MQSWGNRTAWRLTACTKARVSTPYSAARSASNSTVWPRMTYIWAATRSTGMRRFALAICALCQRASGMSTTLFGAKWVTPHCSESLWASPSHQPAFFIRCLVPETGSGDLGEGAITAALQMKPRSYRSTEASSRETLQYRRRLSSRRPMHVASRGKGRPTRGWPQGSDSHTSSACLPGHSGWRFSPNPKTPA